MSDHAQSPRLASFLAWMKVNNLNPRQVSLASNVAYTTINTFTRGETYAMSARNEQKIANTYDSAIETIFVNGKQAEKGAQPRIRQIPVAGYVAANGIEHFISDYAEGDGHDFIDPVIQDVEAAYVISGISMLPRYRPGERVLVGHQTRDPSPWVNKDVVAYIKGRDQTTLKTLKMGRDGKWTLRSINPAFDPIEDVELEWVAPVEWVKV